MWASSRRSRSTLKDLQELAAMAEESDGAILKDLDASAAGVLTSLQDIERQAKFADPVDHNDALVTLHAGARAAPKPAIGRRCSRACMNAMPNARALRWKSPTSCRETKPGLNRSPFSCMAPSPTDFSKAKSASIASFGCLPSTPTNAAIPALRPAMFCPDIQDDIVIKIEDKDLRIDTYRSSGAGGTAHQ